MEPNRPARRIPRVPYLMVAAGAILVAAPLILLANDAPWARWIASMALAWWLPGALWVAHWRLPDLDLPTAAVLALALGLGWLIVVSIGLLWLPGPLHLWTLVAAFEAGALLLALPLIWRPPLALKPVPASTWVWLAALLLFAGLLRLPVLGYHQFHVDEVEVVNRARLALQGADAVLAAHTKGPGEIAVAAAVYRAQGTLTEAMVRLPFALLGVGGVLAVALLGHRLFSPVAGFWAGVLLALNGFVLATARLVQYQAAIVLLSVVAVLAAWEFARGGQGRWLALAAAFSALGLVMHYEFALMAPCLVLLAWTGWRRADHRRPVLSVTLASALLGGLLVAAAYLPILTNPHRARIQRLLGMRLGDLSSFNLPFFIDMGTLYNSTYFFAGLVLLTGLGLILAWSRAWRRALVLTLWFLPLLVLYLFVMRYPGTHYYLFMPSWSLLAALPLAALGQPGVLRPGQSRNLLRWGLLALTVAWMAVSAGYLYLAFFQQEPEYIATYGESRVPIYWAAYGEAVPPEPHFGFPFQQGWKAIGVLGNWGCLQGTWSSNEGSRLVRGWYVRAPRWVRLDQQPDQIFLANTVSRLSPRYNESRIEDYRMVGEISVRDEPRIQIWARQPLPVPWVSYRMEELAPFFDSAVPSLEGEPEPAPRVRDVPLGTELVLQSAVLPEKSLKRGDTLHLLLEWRPQQALAADLKLFVHLVAPGGQIVAQWDGYPCLNLGRTSRWTAGQAVRDHVLLTILDATPPGEYSLLLGMYDETSGQRLGGQAVDLGPLTVR